MKLTLKTGKIDYGSIAIAVLPMLGKRYETDLSAMGKLIFAVSQLPADVICSVFAAFTQEKKNELVAALVMENREKILEAAEKAMEDNGISMNIREFSVTQDLQVELEVNEIDYAGIVARFLDHGGDTASAEHASAELIQKLRSVPVGMRNVVLGMVPQAAKDKLVIYLLMKNKQTLIDTVENLTQGFGINITVDDFVVTAEG